MRLWTRGRGRVLAGGALRLERTPLALRVEGGFAARENPSGDGDGLLAASARGVYLFPRRPGGGGEGLGAARGGRQLAAGEPGPGEGG